MTHINGHEPAEQMVSVIFQGIELSLRLGGEGIRNLAQLIFYSSQNKEPNLNMRSGKVKKIAELLKENKPLRTSKIETKDIPQFKKLAKKYGILYALVKDKNSNDKTCTVILKEEEMSLYKELLDSMGLSGSIPEKAKDIKKNESPSKQNSKGTKKSMVGSEGKESVVEKLKWNKENCKSSRTHIKPKER